MERPQIEEASSEHLVWNRSSRGVDRDFSGGLEEGLQLTRPHSLSCPHPRIAVAVAARGRPPGSDEVRAGCAIPSAAERCSG